MKNDHDIRREHRRAPISIAVVVVLAIAVLSFAVMAKISSLDYEDQLKVLKAETETGKCGSKRVVVIDANRIAVAGLIGPPDKVDNVIFEEREGKLSAYFAPSLTFDDGRKETRRELLWTRDLK